MNVRSTTTRSRSDGLAPAAGGVALPAWTAAMTSAPAMITVSGMYGRLDATAGACSRPPPNTRLSATQAPAKTLTT